MEYRWADGNFEQIPQLAADLVKRDFHLIIAASNREITILKRMTTTIPIVMVNVVDPVGTGLIASLARPGGNLTGLSWDPAVDIVGKHIELLREVVPNLCVRAALRQKVARDMLAAAAATDCLTGLLSRRELDVQTTELMLLARRDGRAFSCLMIDIDYFKEINDRHGHTAGDEVLRHVAARPRGEPRL